MIESPPGGSKLLLKGWVICTRKLRSRESRNRFPPGKCVGGAALRRESQLGERRGQLCPVGGVDQVGQAEHRHGDPHGVPVHRHHQHLRNEETLGIRREIP